MKIDLFSWNALNFQILDFSKRINIVAYYRSTVPQGRRRLVFPKIGQDRARRAACVKGLGGTGSVMEAGRGRRMWWVLPRTHRNKIGWYYKMFFFLRFSRFFWDFLPIHPMAAYFTLRGRERGRAAPEGMRLWSKVLRRVCDCDECPPASRHPY